LLTRDASQPAPSSDTAPSKGSSGPAFANLPHRPGHGRDADKREGGRRHALDEAARGWCVLMILTYCLPLAQSQRAERRNKSSLKAQRTGSARDVPKGSSTLGGPAALLYSSSWLQWTGLLRPSGRMAFPMAFSIFPG